MFCQMDNSIQHRKGSNLSTQYIAEIPCLLKLFFSQFILQWPSRPYFIALQKYNLKIIPNGTDNILQYNPLSPRRNPYAHLSPLNLAQPSPYPPSRLPKLQSQRTYKLTARINFRIPTQPRPQDDLSIAGGLQTPGFLSKRQASLKD